MHMYRALNLSSNIPTGVIKRFKINLRDLQRSIGYVRATWGSRELRLTGYALLTYTPRSNVLCLKGTYGLKGENSG
jgi:hypothetical protein